MKISGALTIVNTAIPDNLLIFPRFWIILRMRFWVWLKTWLIDVL